MRYVVLSLILAGSVLAADGDPVVTWTPGCLAKIYVCGKAEVAEGRDIKTGPAWPIKSLPDSPAETLMLQNIPAVEPPAPSEMFAKNIPANYLLPKSKLLTGGVNFYAVEFEGYYLAPIDGIYTFSVESDDPVTIFVEGKQVAINEFAANPSLGRKSTDADWWHKDLLNDPQVKIETALTQGSVRMSPNRYYHVVILNMQQWYSVTRERYNGVLIMARDFNRGAFFKAFINTPDGKTSSLSLSLPQVK